VFGAIGLAVVLVIVLAIAGACGGGSDDADQGGESKKSGIGSAHGPMSIIDGIPRGFTRDEPGAATAAVNFTQAVDQARQGRISGKKLREVSAGPNPSEALLEVLNDSSDRTESADRVFNAAPGMVSVVTFTRDKAEVSVWAVGVGQSPVGSDGKVSVLALWSTTTVTLQWLDEDWKATDWNFQSGPEPKDVSLPPADSPMAKRAQSGYYSFFIN
jgi:hypothetical protein